MDPINQEDVVKQNSDRIEQVLQTMLDGAAVDIQSMTVERRGILIAELKKSDRPLLASSKAHGP